MTEQQREVVMKAVEKMRSLDPKNKDATFEEAIAAICADYLF
jgi:hypothetical protein